MTWNPFKKQDEAQVPVEESAKAARPEPTTGKGHATPKRKDAQEQNLRPLVPKDRKASAKAAKERRREKENAEYEAMRTGDINHMPKAERLPWRVYIRDYVDARFNIGEFFIPVAFGILIVSMVVSFFWPVLSLPLMLLPAFFNVGMVLAIVGAVGLVLTQGRHEKNILMKPIKGVMSLYDITSYLSDVLSYSRILALGLAGGVIANVFNLLGTMPGFNLIGIIVFVLIFVIGTAFNVAISGLGAYVHTARLQYVEFFGKFYEAGGRPFKPFQPNTKYTLISDKEDF